MEAEEEQLLQQLQNQADAANVKSNELALGLAGTTYQSQTGNNLIEFQLDTATMLEKIEHFLRGDYIAIDEDGADYWEKQKNSDLILFNDYGVNALMLIIGNYIDKNTMLSQYDEMRINQILGDLGDELVKFIFCNYEKMGMDTDFKKTRFELTVITLLNTIESAYRRALNGKTMEDLNSSKIFTQSDMIGNRVGAMGGQTKKKFHMFKPSTW